MNDLLEMLTYRRPHNSVTEAVFIEDFLIPIGAERFGVMADGTAAAYVVRVPIQMQDYEEDSRTLFSSHTDTVHREDGIQPIVYDDGLGIVYKDDGAPLGADDGAGVWLMVQMIKAGIPGTYLFHRGEERGGIGSKFIASNYSEFMQQFDRAVAFDRRGTTSVITHQGYGRCCSDAFAGELADRLKTTLPLYKFAPDSTGVYTDTAEYTDLVPECTNVSCGYLHEHTSAEILDVEFLVALKDACIALDWESLPTVRVPGEVDDDKYGSLWPWKDGDMSRYGNYLTIEEFLALSDEDVEEVCWETPEVASDILIQLRDYAVFKQ